jgi:hypothetical protein
MLPLASLINPDDPDRAWAWVRRAAEDGDAAARKIVGAGRPRWRWPGWVQRPPRSILGTSYWLLERATLNPWRVTANRSRLGLAYLRIQNPAGLQPHLAALREELYKGERVKAILAARLPGDPKTVIVLGATDQRLLEASQEKKHPKIVHCYQFAEISHITSTSTWQWTSLEFRIEASRSAT